MKICVLQPDYSTTSVDYQYYDPPRNLSPLLPEAEVHHLFLNKLTVFKQLKEASKQNYDCFVNLCEGYLHWEIPSIDVIYSLQLLELPFTGPTMPLYDPPKEIMKYVAYTEGIKSPAYAVVRQCDDVGAVCSHLAYPLFIKPAHAGDSLGIDEGSLVNNEVELNNKVQQLWEQYDEVLVEEFIDGREFTVLVAAGVSSPKSCIAFTPLEYIFPAGRNFKTYALKTSELHKESNLSVKDDTLAELLKTASKRIFCSFGGVSYARLDFRMNAQGDLYFLEINFTCSVFYNKGYEGSADYILQGDGIGQGGFLKYIIEEAMARHDRRKKKYFMKGNSISGFGIYAVTGIKKGDVIFCGEEEEHRLVTKRHVEQTWSQEEKKTFQHYAYPISDEIYSFWGKEPANWAPQNHSCNANTAYNGLNVVALKDILKDEELTLNYAHILNETAASFDCNCGTESCRKQIHGEKNNSLTNRQKL
ncbi:MAG: SET domain-containing protein-lysine N-methyltransferase [Bacteroidota bacterium]|nr:SET domain-containing protein-lysine N-methyltransferase [Bacteroidota bacterium]